MIANIKPDCPHHENVEIDLRHIKEVQRLRDCQEHKARLVALEASDEKQWTAIGSLRENMGKINESVWFARGLVTAGAVLGSALGSAIVTYLTRR